MYSREIDNQVLTFGVSGKLIRNALVMYDRETDTLWSQLLGRAVEGQLEGEVLEFVPAVHTTWADWKSQHPETVALIKGSSGGYDSYSSYYASEQAGIMGETTIDERLYIKEFVIGVEAGEQAVAYPWRVLNNAPLVNDKVGGTPLLVSFTPDTGASRVWSREVGERTLTFERESAGRLRDVETGTLWHRESGQAIRGPLAGETLKRIKSTTVFWFAWKDWHPDTELYGVTGSRPDG